MMLKNYSFAYQMDKDIPSPGFHHHNAEWKIFFLKATSWGQWLTLVIPATWEAEIKRIEVWGQPRQTVPEIPFSTNSWVWWYTWHPS
jgi:hypothetical protein